MDQRHTECNADAPLEQYLKRRLAVRGGGDVVVVVSGRNADEDAFRQWIDVPALERV